jgi:hypothetical protein
LLAVGICWIRKPMIPGSGCGRIAQLTKIEAEIHAVSRVLQVAPSNSIIALPHAVFA